MKRLNTIVLAAGLVTLTAHADQVILDDLIVDGSICAGLDCVNGESFGFDTLRLKENNLRIKFQDTSASAEFPTRDWQITANDSANGGMEKFSIDDIDGGRTPFTIEANAPTHSLYVDDGGRIGLGTSTPVVEAHMVDGDTPTIRLEQDGSSGFTPQTWDMAGNETNFFIRDVTNGSNLPFRIRPAAPQNSIFVDADGDIGMGTASPAFGLEVQRLSTAAIGVINTTATVAPRTLFKLENSGNTKFEIAEKGSGNNWAFTNSGSDFRVSLQGSGVIEFLLQNNGDAELAGVLFQNSDRDAKTNIVPVDPETILEKVAALPIAHWSYKDAADETHIGPMAQDFRAAFGTGRSDKTLTTIDTSGVALASIQALNRKLEQENQGLRSELSELRDQLKLIQNLVQEMKPRVAAE